MHEGPVIHFGLPKAGSTFLQRHVFPNMKHWEFIQDRVLYHLLTKEYWYNFETIPPVLLDKSSRYILSWENLSHLVSSIQQREAYNSRNISFCNLMWFYKDVGTFLIVLRRQDSIIESLIKYKAPFFSKESDIFMDLPVSRSHGSVIKGGKSKRGFLLDSYDYYNYLMRYVSVVGKDRVKILLFEDLEYNPQKFFENLGNIFGQDLGELAALSQNRVNVSNTHSILMPSLVKAIDRRMGGVLEGIWPETKTVLSERMKTEIMEVFREGNKNLFKYFGIENKYGYY